VIEKNINKKMTVSDIKNIFTKFVLIGKMFLPLQPKKIEVEIR